MRRFFQVLAIVFLVVTTTGVVDLDLIFGHVDDCADRCCQSIPGPNGSSGSQSHCSCCCVSHHVTEGPSTVIPDGIGRLAVLRLDHRATPRSAAAVPVFHPPRA